MEGIEKTIETTQRNVIIYSKGVSALASYAYGDIVKQLGYNPVIVQNDVQLREHVASLNPLAVILDMDFDDQGNETYTKAVNDDRRSLSKPQPTLEEETFQHMREQIDAIHGTITSPVIALTHSKKYRKDEHLKHKVGAENVLSKDYLKDNLDYALQRASHTERRPQVAVYVNGLRPLFEDLLGDRGMDVIYADDVRHITGLVGSGHRIDLVIADLDLADKNHIDLASNLGWTGIPIIATYQGCFPQQLKELGMSNGERETLIKLGVYPIERADIGRELYPTIDRLIGSKLEPRMD